MFSNIGRKIKIFGMAVFWLGLAAAAIIVVLAVSNTGSPGVAILTVLPAVLWIVLGVVVASFMLYGFGELVDRTRSIREKMKDSAAE